MITTTTITRMKMRAPTPPTTAPMNSNIENYHECASGQHIIECHKPGCMGGRGVVMAKPGCMGGRGVFMTKIGVPN